MWASLVAAVKSEAFAVQHKLPQKGASAEMIGENGDAGELTIEAQVVAAGYETQQAGSAFQITEG